MRTDRRNNQQNHNNNHDIAASTTTTEIKPHEQKSDKQLEEITKKESKWKRRLPSHGGVSPLPERHDALQTAGLGEIFATFLSFLGLFVIIFVSFCFIFVDFLLCFFILLYFFQWFLRFSSLVSFGSVYVRYYMCIFVFSFVFCFYPFRIDSLYPIIVLVFFSLCCSVLPCLFFFHFYILYVFFSSSSHDRLFLSPFLHYRIGCFFFLSYSQMLLYSLIFFYVSFV